MIPGLNIQAPWAELIVSGAKTIETRSYPLPRKHENVVIAVIETPGPKRLVLKSRIVGLVVFSHSVRYATRTQWKEDKPRHLVDGNDDQFKYDSKKPKYGWVVKRVFRLKNPVDAPSSRGIVF